MAVEQPKKPVGGAYGAFMNEKRAEFLKALAGQKASAVATMASAEWKKLDDAQKAPYQAKYEAAKAKFDTDMAAFLASGGEKSKGVQAQRSEKKKASEGGKAKAKDPNRPKKPAGGSYGVFLAENRSKIVQSLPAGHSITDVAKAAGAQFKALSEDDKKPYEATYQQKKAAYAKAMAEYKASHPDAADEDEDGEEKEEASPKASPKKRAAADQNAAPGKRGRGAAKPSEPEAPAVDAAVLKEAEALKLDGPLKNLMARPDVVAKGASQKQILEALKKSDGLVNKAKAAILGA